MHFLDTQNPGIGGLDELTDAETALVQQINGLGDPNADRILFWDDSANSYKFLSPGTNLTITNTTIDAASGSGITRSVNSVAINTTAGTTTATDYVYLVTGTTTITLPTAIGNTNQYDVKSVSGATTVNTTSSQTINGSLTITIRNGDVITFLSNGSNWNVI